MAARPHPCDVATIAKYRHQHGNIGQMHCAAIGVVGDEHVTIVDSGLAEIADDAFHHLLHRAGEENIVWAHADDLAIRQVETGVAVIGLGDER